VVSLVMAFGFRDIGRHLGVRRDGAISVREQGISKGVPDLTMLRYWWLLQSPWW
jgi:hypothetical protein